MQKSRLIFPASLAAMIFVTMAMGGMARAQQAPDWVLLKADGESVSLSDLRGRPVLLHFWATWCPYCKRLQPGLNSLYNEYRDQGLEVLGISFREDEGAEPQAVLNERGVDFLTVIDGDDVAAAYGVKATPTNVFIDRDGNITTIIADSDPENPAFESAVLEILALE